MKRKYIMPNSPWNEEGRTEQLLALRAEGLSFRQIADRMGLSRMAVGNRLRHLRLGPAARSKPRMPRDLRSTVKGEWTEENLTEKWADRRKRKGSQ